MEDLGILIIRLVLGLSFVGHGSQKLFGWFGGYGIKGTGGWMESVGIKPGAFMAALAGILEFIGGLLFTTGLFFTLGSAMIVIAMLGAMKVHLPNGYWADKGGIEYPFVIVSVAIGLALIGPGAYSM
ncbi:DoxX family protein [Brevibacillus choshinensis]|uniref:DoxX family protein n=1 Tax=Brevibacillus choshinensis TaxID=54911 RepID=UPI002E1D6EB7|nr:DoxX family protein [Brevibacillus choshinensis]MED4752225.1 DoxX family protein [Brevibacillus choshinensis]